MPGDRSPLRILLADDHPIFRAGLKGLLDAEHDMQVIAEAADGEAACAAVEALRPDVLVTDFTMPKLDGATVAARARRLHPALQVVALSVHEDRAYVARLLEAGASAYVLKRTAADVLVQAIRAAARGDVFLDPAVAHLVTGASAPTARPFFRPPTGRELEVLVLYCRGRGTKEIAAALGVGTRTVETYLARVREKLGMRHRADLVRYAEDAGLLA